MMAWDSEMRRQRKSTFGLKRGQLADLFAIAVREQGSTEEDQAEQDLSEKLRCFLTEVIPNNSLLFPSAPEIPGNELCDVTRLTGRSLQEVLFSLEASVEQLQIVKEGSKRLTKMSTSEAEHAIATTIYHAAIACCLVQNNRKITQHTYEKLDKSFSLLIDKKWMADELVQLFSQARCICRSKRSKK